MRETLRKIAPVIINSSILNKFERYIPSGIKQQNDRFLNVVIV